MPKPKLAIILTAVAVLVTVGVFIKAHSDDSVNAAMTILRNTPTVASATVGPGFEPTVQYWAYCRVFDSPNAVAVFRALLADSGSARQLYALLALSELDPEYFETHRVDVPKAPPVSTFTGCFYNADQNPSDVLAYMLEHREFFRCLDTPPRSIVVWVDIDRPIFDRIRSSLFGPSAEERWRQRLEQVNL